MSEYLIRYSAQAIRDLQASYDWGIENWGRDRADDWVYRLAALIAKRLSTLPLACPVAPESRDFSSEMRHLVFYRYRVLFTVDGNKVYILRIRGPFSGNNLKLE